VGEFLDQALSDLLVLNVRMAFETKPSELLTAATVAKLLDVSISWLELHRRRGDGPPYVRLSRTKGVRYPARDLKQWIRQRVQG